MTIRIRQIKNPSGNYYDLAESYQDKNGRNQTKIFMKIGIEPIFKAKEEKIRSMVEKLNNDVAFYNKFGLRIRDIGLNSGNKAENLDDCIRIFDELSREKDDFERTNAALSLTSHFPIRKLWETLNLDKCFIECQKIHARYKKNKEGFKYDKLNFNLDKAVFFLVAERIIQPASKYDSWVRRNKHFFNYSDIEIDDIYKSLESLSLNKDRIIKHLNNNVKELFERELTVSLYDVTTLYFDSIAEDEFRQSDYSIDNKTNETQVVLGLLSDSNGIPISYEIFSGKTAEVNSLLELIEKARKDFKIKKVTIVTDEGLKQLEDIQKLSQNGYTWIVTFPPNTLKLTKAEKNLLIKNEGWEEKVDDDEVLKVKEVLIEKEYCDKETDTSQTIEGRYIVTYNSRRREYDLNELDIKIKRAAEESDSLNKNKIKETEKWAGYKGYLTNDFSADSNDIIKKIENLGKIEAYFRTVKPTIISRPRFSYDFHSIRGHVLTSYLALFLTKTLQQLLKNDGINLSDRQIVRALQSKPLMLVDKIRSENEKLYFCCPDNLVAGNHNNNYDEDCNVYQDGTDNVKNLDTIMECLGQVPLNGVIQGYLIKSFLKLKIVNIRYE